MSSLEVSTDTPSTARKEPVTYHNPIETPQNKDISAEPVELTPVEEMTTHRAEKAPSTITVRKAFRREARKAARLEIIRRGARQGCEGFRLLPSASWKLANPVPIGLWGMGMTYILYSLPLTGHWELYAVITGMMVVFGGGIQMVSGCLCYARGNTFPWTVLTLNGAFWLSVVGITNLPDKTRPRGPPIVSKPTSYFEGTYYLLWAIVALVLAGASLRTNLVTVLTLLAQLLWFILLAVAYMAESESTTHASGYVGCVVGGLALVSAYAQIVNEVFDKTIIAVVPMSIIWRAVGIEKDPAKANTGQEASAESDPC